MKKGKMTQLEARYVELVFRTSNNVNYDQLFATVAAQLDRDEKTIRNHMDKLETFTESVNLPPVPPPEERVKLTHLQKQIRDMATPGRETTPVERHVTIMSEALSEMVENNPPPSVKGSSKIRGCVFRQ